MGRPAYFTPAAEGLVPHESARSWWVPDMIHGRLLGGLLARALQTEHGAPEFQFSRLTVDLFRNAPFEPVQVTTEVVRQGRRIQVTEARVHTSIGVVARAGAVQLRRGEQPPSPVPTRTPPWTAPDPATMPRSVAEFGDDPTRRRMWVTEKSPLVDGEVLSPFVRVALAADMASPLAHRGEADIEFINADYTLTLSRDPVGTSIGLESGGHASDDGVAVGHCTMHDVEGPIGFSMAVAVANVRAG
ncbi:thioesterase family protein [Blastococcus sp. TML/M2B]|uniref:acyl-CoA thioesterase domain-containing protein n=1 Tax=unclassified Blastococcus TaxID=2619396 RepID=UPI001909B8BD|nr:MULTISPECIES: acyl-CoA thioesterase domain-containing protein [unclassified Blastococcus]MBN1093363.1 thioesterase family protein [Blastococcus sp. TML/M2B]MBN1096521.1 thioesterase family protein [Blastococcus sp. TML/C7B]